MNESRRVTRLPVGVLLPGTLGLFLVLFSLLLLRWPAETNNPAVVGPHFLRVLTPPEGENSGVVIARVILNVGIYIIWIIAAVSLLNGWLRGSLAAMRTFALMAGLGLLYMAGLALYTSGCVAVIGFMLMLASAVVAHGAASVFTARAETLTLVDSIESRE